MAAKAREVCSLCEGTRRVAIRLRGGEVEASCPECLEGDEGLWCALCGAPVTGEDHALYVKSGVVEPVCEGCRG